MKSRRKPQSQPGEPRRMKFDGKALVIGLLLLAAIPLLMMWQSSNKSKGTGPGKSKYNEYQHISVLSMYLATARPDNANRQILHIFCMFVLGIHRNGEYAAAWIDHVAKQCGECADVHLARAWLFMFTGNAKAMNDEFAAARAAAADQAELDRINAMIAEVMNK